MALLTSLAGFPAITVPAGSSRPAESARIGCRSESNSSGHRLRVEEFRVSVRHSLAVSAVSSFVPV